MSISQPSVSQTLVNRLRHHSRVSRLGRRLFVDILIISSVLVLLSTTFLAFVDYRKDVARVSAQMAQIRDTHVGGIESSLWTLDSPQVNTLLDGIRQLPDIAYLEITTNTRDRYTTGSLENIRRSISREFPLRHGEEVIGTLKVVATLDSMIQRLWYRALWTLATQFLMIFLLSLFLLLLFSNRVTRHLSTMADYASRLNLNHLGETLALERSRTQGSAADELDQVVNAFNEMRLSLQEDVEARAKAEEEVRTLNTELESRVEERTSQLAQANEALQAATHAKSVFLSNMSHELRTPLNAILGFAGLLRRSVSMGDQDRDRLDRIHRAGEHLLGLINDVLSISKIEAGKLELNPVPFGLRTVAKGIQDMMQFRTQEKGLALDVELDPELPETCLGDEGKLRQVLINLLGNAVKFTATGTIGLRMRAQEGRVRFEVWDTGAGIAPHELQNLFQEFTQTETGRQSKEGTGLGLHISKAMVKLMGGELKVESQVGKGTQFHFSLDLEAVQGEVRKAAEPRRILGLAKGERARKLLVVDDQVDNRDVARELLEAWGFKVEVAEDGISALEQWERWKPEAIFMDMRMPRMGGEEAVSRLREREGSNQRTPVFALTASVLDLDRDRVLSAGFDEFLQKPFQEHMLAEVLERYLGLHFASERPEESRPEASTDILWDDMPEEWRQRFRQALLLGDLDEAEARLEELGQHPARNYLESKLKGFCIDELLQQMGE